MKTVDGGLNWSEESAFPATVEVYKDIIFITNRVGWVFSSGGIVWRTIDGGHSWSTSNVDFGSDEPIIVQDAVFVNSKLGFAAGMGGLSKTADGGRTWRPLSVENADKHLYFDGIAASKNAVKIWAFGARGFQSNYSEDGGKNWTLIRGLYD